MKSKQQIIIDAEIELDFKLGPVSEKVALSALEILEGEMKPYLRHLDECEVHEPVNVWPILERDDIESLSKEEFDIEVEKLRKCSCGLDQLKNK